MLRTTTFQRVLLISLVVLLSTSKAGSASAGIRTGLNPTFTCDGVSEIPRVECEALVALYDSTNGPGWGRQAGWLVTDTPCTWYGVTCQAGHVQWLDLSHNQLSGAIPACLGNLANLTLLDLSFNQLSGAIPPELGNLVSLGALHLGYNQLSGAIPPELGNLVSLGLLHMGYNQLSGAIPHELGNLANLRELCLGGNRLSDAIPPELGNLANLQVLCLGGNRLSGAIPPELGNLAELQGLFLNDNPLSGALPRSLMNLNLISFYFNNTHLCEPPDATFQAWLAGIYDLRRTGVVCSYAYLPLCSH